MRIPCLIGAVILAICASGCGSGGGSSSPAPLPVTPLGPTISLLPGVISADHHRVVMDLGVVSSQPATVAWSVLAGEPTLMGIGLPGVGGATELIFTANGTWLLRARVSDAGGREDARVYRIDVDAPLAPVLAGQVLEGDGVATPRAGLPVRLVWHDDADRVTTIRSATTAHDGSWSFAGVIIPVDELRVVVGP